MNNIFIEGPVQTGKSTLIRRILKEKYGPNLERVAGFTSQRVTDSGGNLLGFRLAPAGADLSAALDSFGVSSVSEIDNVFKYFAADGPHIDMDVFESAGIGYMNEALNKAKAGQSDLVLLDEIGGHELASGVFRNKLYELLDSDCLCVGVIKSSDTARRMDPALTGLNAELHKKIPVTDNRDEFERSLRAVINSI